LITALAHLVRLARAGTVLAREGVFGLIDPADLPPGARLLLRTARIIERPNAGLADSATDRTGNPQASAS